MYTGADRTKCFLFNKTYLRSTTIEVFFFNYYFSMFKMIIESFTYYNVLFFHTRLNGLTQSCGYHHKDVPAGLSIEELLNEL